MARSTDGQGLLESRLPPAARHPGPDAPAQGLAAHPTPPRVPPGTPLPRRGHLRCAGEFDRVPSAAIRILVAGTGAAPHKRRALPARPRDTIHAAGGSPRGALGNVRGYFRRADPGATVPWPASTARQGRTGRPPEEHIPPRSRPRP